MNILKKISLLVAYVATVVMLSSVIADQLDKLIKSGT